MQGKSTDEERDKKEMGSYRAVSGHIDSTIDDIKDYVGEELFG